MKAIVLAAGEGKRLKPLTNDKPKCMLKYRNDIILERLLNQIKNQAVNEIIVVVGFILSTNLYLNNFLVFNLNRFGKIDL